MTTINNNISNGRFCNQLIRSIATSLVAEKHNLAVRYSISEKLSSIGLELFSGEKSWESTIPLSDLNYFDILNCEKLDKNVDPNRSFFQTREIIQYIYEFIRCRMETIISSNKFNQRYNKNNDCFVHVRLDDAAQWNPGFEYYDKAIGDLKYDTLYISSDQPNHPIISKLTSKYPSTIIQYNEVNTIQFASTCKHIVLSHGTFSACIGYFSFFSNVYYPNYANLRRWHGDIFSISGWNNVYFMLSKDDIITTDKYLQAFPNYYYKIDSIVSKNPIWWRGKLVNPPTKNQPLIVSGHSDHGITDDLVKYYSPTKWWTVNKQTTNTTVHSLPLGITNNTNESAIHSIYGNLDSMIQVMEEVKQNLGLVYMNFNISTYPQERQQVYDMFKHREWVTKGTIENTLEGRTRFLREIRNHTFVLCPRGNGVDTHRLWETLYMGSIPIVKRDIALKDFEDLPICFIDSWEEVTPEFLEKERERILNSTWNMEKLKISYWVNEIHFKNTTLTYKMTDWDSMNTGQIKLHQSLGLWIQKYAEDTRFSRYLEIGTWNGGGSTVCFGSGFSSRTDSPKLISLETNFSRVNEAKTLWNNFSNIEILHGRILDETEIPTFEMVNKIHSNIVYDWHKVDIENFKSASYFDLSKYNPEVVVLDGGEYMTYFEYLKIKDTVNVFLLDDTAVAKCQKIVNELSNNPLYSLVAGNVNERNGWHVFEKKTI